MASLDDDDVEDDTQTHTEKKRRLSNENDETITNEEEKEEEDGFTDTSNNEERVLAWSTQWRQRDRKAMLHLLTHPGKPGFTNTKSSGGDNSDRTAGAGIAMYRWDESGMILGTPAAASRLLGCEYDIVFVHGVPEGTDQDYADEAPISRTMAKGGTVSFCATPKTDHDFWCDDGALVVDGTIQNIVSSAIKHYDSQGRHDGSWQYLLQINDAQIREYECGRGNGLLFSLTQQEGMQSDGDGDVTIRVLANDGTLEWTPTESESATDNEDAHQDYSRHARTQMQGDYDRTWKNSSAQESWWLRRHLHLPVQVVSHIHSFCHYPLPPPQWSFRAGDLLIEIQKCEYATSWTTQYVARPRDEGVRQELLCDLVFPTTTPDSDSDDSDDGDFRQSQVEEDEEAEEDVRQLQQQAEEDVRQLQQEQEDWNQGHF